MRYRKIKLIPFQGNSESRSGGGRSSNSPGRPGNYSPPDLGFIGGGAGFAKVLFYIVLGVVVVTLVGLVVWAIINREKAKKDPGVATDPTVVTDEQRIEELPFQLDSAYKDLLDRARAYLVDPMLIRSDPGLRNRTHAYSIEPRLTISIPSLIEA